MSNFHPARNQVTDLASTSQLDMSEAVSVARSILPPIDKIKPFTVRTSPTKRVVSEHDVSSDSDIGVHQRLLTE